MDDPLIRRMVIALFALLPTFLFALAGQSFEPPMVTPRDLQAAQIAALPGGPDEAPLLTGAMAEPTLSADQMDEARARNLTDPFYAGPITAATPFKFAGSSADRRDRKSTRLNSSHG